MIHFNTSLLQTFVTILQTTNCKFAALYWQMLTSLFQPRCLVYNVSIW